MVGVGEYQLCQPYKSYDITSKEWFKKKQRQTARIIQRFAKAELNTVGQVEQNNVSPEAPSDVTDQDGHLLAIP